MPSDRDIRLTESLRRIGPWDEAFVLPTTGSTNADVVTWLTASPSGPPRQVVVVADHQAGGRGRLGRSWSAPPGTSVAVSASLPATAAVDPGWVPLIAGLAVREGLLEATGLGTGLKWPNDVLVPGPASGAELKVCGVLCDRVPEPDSIVVGMGINLTQARAQLPVPTATSLALAGVSADRDEVVVAVLRALDRWYRRLADGGDGPAAVRDAYSEACLTIGRPVRVELAAGPPRVGTATAIATDGRLVVTTSSGLREEFAAGDVHHLRPAQRPSGPVPR